ncbi:LamB/YcsF family protein [Aneurinibacillus terranovensis]|uniref:LamB/YcsF family protein n=1 Tax=Aneurinibacillus terranovensis TaxID=278991 RepID=UPI0004850D14|nr:5-oxoprolinase subunit PxpA [Aneurinibacillus terranovensis]
MKKVDLNCDMGESFGLYSLGQDEEMMKYITSANIACGYHAGDPHVMRKTVELAKQYHVAIGAHPGFPDLIGFGRRYMNCTPYEIKDYITYQMGALREFASASGLRLQHCKPHGALFMMAMEDENLAQAILESIAEIDSNTVVYALNNSAVAYVGEKLGIPVALEVYSDRQHTKNGSIVLTRKGSQIEDYSQMAQRVVRMIKDGRVTTADGEEATVQADTVCIHGDTPGAAQLAKAIVHALKENDIQIAPVREVLGVRA